MAQTLEKMNIIPERETALVSPIEKLNLDDWREQISKPLQFIEAGAAMAARHARMLPARPVWETKAEAELIATRQVLESALANVIAAQAIYASKSEAA
jgi:hypothetical protein